MTDTASGPTAPRYMTLETVLVLAILVKEHDLKRTSESVAKRANVSQNAAYRALVRLTNLGWCNRELSKYDDSRFTARTTGREHTYQIKPEHMSTARTLLDNSAVVQAYAFTKFHGGIDDFWRNL